MQLIWISCIYGDVVAIVEGGSTSIAADKTARASRGLELAPLYVDVIVHRYDAHPGKSTIFLATGETFEAAEMRRFAHGVAPIAAAPDIEGEITDVSAPNFND
jgi:hypothetical protein